MDREALERWCERGILSLVLTILVFGPLATGSVRTADFLVLQGLTLGVMVLWGLRLWISPRPQLLWPPICWAVLLFVAYAIGRYLTADIEYVGRQELLRILVYAFLFFAILNNLHRQEHTQIIAFTLIFLGMAESFYALYQFLTHSNRVLFYITPYEHRGVGTYISPNNLAGFLEMLLPLGLAYTIAGRVKPLTRVLVGYASLVMMAGIASTLSRGGLIATVMALVMFFGLLLPRRSLRIQALVLLALLLVGTLYLAPKSYNLQQRLASIPQGRHDVERDIRYEIWDATVRMWQDNFWWGVGPGHFDYRFREYRPDLVQVRPDRAHNEYLNALADWGVVGTAIVALAVAVLWAGMFKTWRHVHRAERDFGTKLTNKFAFVLGASLGLVALTIHSVVDFNLHIPANAILAITLMALLTGHVRFATERYWTTARLGHQLALSAALLAGITCFSYQGWRLGREAVWLGRDSKLKEVFKAPLSAPARIAALRKAFEAEPKNFETTFSIGEAYRAQSWQAFDAGYDVYVEPATNALAWYALGMKLNPFDARNHLSSGMCLDRLGKTNESEPYYQRADELDPAGYFTAANIGWHYVQIGDFAAAKPWFDRSSRLGWVDNSIATNYLDLVKRRLREAAAPPASRPKPQGP